VPVAGVALKAAPGRPHDIGNDLVDVVSTRRAPQHPQGPRQTAATRFMRAVTEGVAVPRAADSLGDGGSGSRWRLMSPTGCRQVTVTPFSQGSVDDQSVDVAGME